MEIKNVSLVNKCTGCGLCSFVCPKDAIQIKEDPSRKHFIFPLIDNEKCINCRLCLNKCPNHNVPSKPLNLESKVFHYRRENEKELIKSSSGGAFQAIAKLLFNGNCSIYGAAWNGFKVEHKRIDSLEELDALLSSKYVQSYIDKSIYKDIKEDIKNGMMVIFSGTPCQIAAVSMLLNESEKKNLYLVELLCHGVPNQWAFDQCIKYENRLIKGQITNFSFRYKVDNYSENRKFRYEYLKGDQKYQLIADNVFFPYYRYFHTCSIYRDSCYECNFRTNRLGDIVIGDLWYASEMVKSIKCDWSHSVMVPLTEKGEELANKLAELTSLSIKDVTEHNGSFLYNKAPDKKYEGFYKELESIENYKKMRPSLFKIKAPKDIKNTVKFFLNIVLPKSKRKSYEKVTRKVSKI